MIIGLVNDAIARGENLQIKLVMSRGVERMGEFDEYQRKASA